MSGAMTLSMWTYPWDVQDLGPGAVVDELRHLARLNTISLAASYHAGHFVQPRSPRRKSYFPEDGTIYFRPTPSRWEAAAIRPKPARIIEEGGDVLAELIRRREAGGISVSCWTVCLHNTRLGMLHPEVVTRNAIGDPSYFSLCPSNPLARAYARALVADLSHAYRPDRIELETPCFMGFVHEYHHEKDGVGLAPEDDLLWSLCFCDACSARAARAGVSAEAARRTVAAWIAEACERAIPAPRWPELPAAGADAFRAHPEVFDYLRWRFEPVTSLIAELREVAHPATRVCLIDWQDGWLRGCDVAAASAACDGVILCAYAMQPGAVAALVGAGGAPGAGKVLGAGYRLFYPEITGAADLAARLRPALAAGVNSLNFYNYGLIPRARLGWIGQALAETLPGGTLPMP